MSSKTKKEQALDLYKKDRKEIFKPLEKHLRKVIKALKKRFDKEGIGIPFPQTDIHFDKEFYRSSKNGNRKRR